MSPLLIAMLGVMLVPLFVATWRTSLLGLSGQGLLMALITWSLDAGTPTASTWLTLVDVGLVRGLVLPIALYMALRRQAFPARLDVIAPSLLSWTTALGLVLIAFNVAEQLVADAGDQRTLVAVATAGVLLGFLALSTRGGPLGQIIGALRLENAIALLELGGDHDDSALGVQGGLLVVFIATVAYYRWYLVTLGPTAAATPALDAEGPAL